MSNQNKNPMFPFGLFCIISQKWGHTLKTDLEMSRRMGKQVCIYNDTWNIQKNTKCQKWENKNKTNKAKERREEKRRVNTGEMSMFIYATIN